MQEEIKEILDKLRETADYPKLNYSSYDKSYNETIDNVAMIKSFACKQLLDYITNLQEYETIIEMEFKREYAKRYLEERRKEEPHLLYPDSDEIYKRYYELKEENEYFNHCDEELRNKITNLKYKIERLENELKEK